MKILVSSFPGPSAIRFDRWLITPVLLGFLLSPTAAESRLIFPRVSFEANTITGLTVVNPNAGDAVVTFTMRADTGQLATVPTNPGFTNPRMVTVKGNSQFADVISNLFAGQLPPETVAWIEATSSSDNLTGFFLYLNNTVTLFDGADLPPAAPQLVFNDVRVGGGNSTELNIVNPNSVPTSVVLELRGPATNRLPAFVIPAHGVRRIDVATAFSMASFEGPAAIAVSASNSVVGFQFIRGPSDLLGTNARPTSETLNVLYFPQLAVLGPFESQLEVNNYSDQSVLVSVAAHRSDGSLYGAETLAMNPVSRLLGPNEVLREDLESMFGFFGPTALDGWLEVVANTPSINGTISYSTPVNGSIAAVSAPALGTRRALFSYLATTQGFFTGIAALNAGAQAANFRVVVLQPNGTRVGTYDGVLQKGQRISRLITELIPASANRAGGMIWVLSDIPIYLTSLFGSVQSGVLANIPPQPVPSGFRPDAGVTQYQILPPFVVLQPNGTQNFQLSTTPAGSVNWAVPNGQGTISAQGGYKAPAAAPASNPAVVTAQIGSQQAAATVDILQSSVLVGGLGTVQSVAFLRGLQRLYTAELGASGVGTSFPLEEPLQGAGSTTIFDVTTGRQTVTTVNGTVSKMVDFPAIDGKEYLLIADQTGGRILRLEPQSKTVQVVRQGLSSPNSIVLVAGSLAVATSTGVSVVSPGELNVGLTAASTSVEAPDYWAVEDQGTLGIATVAPPFGGIVLDDCSGRAIVSLPNQGAIAALFPDQIIAEGLSNPGQIFALYRSGVPCPASLHLLVVERGRNRISLVIPEEGRVIPWLSTSTPVDLTFIPESTFSVPQGTTLPERVLIADRTGTSGRILQVPLPGLYEEQSDNPTRVVTAVDTFTTFTSSAQFFSLSELYELNIDEFNDLSTVIPPGSVRGGVEFTAFPDGESGLVANRFNSLNSSGTPCGGAPNCGSLHVLRPAASDPTSFFGGGQCLDVRFLEPVLGTGIYFNIFNSQTLTDYVYISTPVGSAFSGGPQYDTSTFFFVGILSDTPFSTARFCGTQILPSGFNLDRLVSLRQR